MIRSLSLWAVLFTTATMFAEEPAWPTVNNVEAQPLLAQAIRLDQALATLGQPLPEATRKAIAGLQATDPALPATIQKLLDPQCLAAVEIGDKGVEKVTAAAGKQELLEQGWRISLVKVVNKSGSMLAFKPDSPAARPVPGGPKDEVANRSLILLPYGGQPLLPNLSGLGLEYTILQIYSRDAGEKTAEISFRVEKAIVPKNSKPDPKTATASAKFTFDAKQSIPVTFQVSEFDGTPTMAAFLIRDIAGRVYPAQAKRLAPDFFFQQQIYRSTGETVRLPAGKYTVICSRGPESVPETKELVVGDKPGTFRYTVNRWIDPSKTNWFSGDHHIHAAGCLHYDNPTEGVEPADMMRHVLGEDLKVGCCLTWGPCFDYQKRFFTGKPDDVSKYPYLLRYDVEVSGFGSHASGHLDLLRLKEQIFPGGTSKTHWPTLGMNTLRWAKKQGAVTGPAHSANGLTRFVGRIEGAKDGEGKLPNFNIPAYDGIGANEFIVDVTHNVPNADGTLVPAIDFISTMDTDRTAEWNMWYHVLNCGFRTRASGETDFPCITGERVGLGRVYAKVDGKLDFDRWVQSIADGRSYISDGTTHLMDFTATSNEIKLEVGTKGSEVKLEKPGEITFTVKAASWKPLAKTADVELVVNGRPLSKQALPTDGKVHDLTFKANISESSWVALRVTPSAHTNPFFVVVDDKPVRASKHSAEWCFAGVEQCWKSKKGTYHKDELKQAEADYDHARKVFKTIIGECVK
ncbi:CehA/McbA family metallohydrolase [Zavarzinella formosa]|uniref:CehA/McbA family metallohydrolase n=1 Tax=Zavarzinella formosa TaxID=360055 RepID=UPI00031CABF4|nr:CehA/McbA family metallohydrolase [Zavarzinella formosa]